MCFEEHVPPALLACMTSPPACSIIFQRTSLAFPRFSGAGRFGGIHRGDRSAPRLRDAVTKRSGDRTGEVDSNDGGDGAFHKGCSRNRPQVTCDRCGC